MRNKVITLRSGEGEIISKDPAFLGYILRLVAIPAAPVAVHIQIYELIHVILLLRVDPQLPEHRKVELGTGAG